MSFGIFPAKIKTDVDLENALSLPSERLVSELAELEGDITILGVGGKMGPTLARMAKRAAPHKRVIGVARFSQPGLKQKLEQWDVETVSCDLMDREAVENLDKSTNVIFMAGRKFGSSDDQPFTWAVNTHMPSIVAEAFPESRIVVFSTACVYPFVSVTGAGAHEQADNLNPPGEYANSCVGRERVFEYFARARGIQVAIIRLSYAIDMRYGVLHDVARSVRSASPIKLGSGHCNVIWQGDASECALRSLKHAANPPIKLNISGPETVSIRSLAERFGEYFGQAPVFEGTEQPHAWLVDTGRQQQLFGYPRVPLSCLVEWTFEWLEAGGHSFDKPTHFEARDGNY